MEPPDGAVLRDGAWHYRPPLPPLAPLRLARTPEAGDYELCFGGGCQLMAEWVGIPQADRPALDRGSVPNRRPGGGRLHR